MYYKITNKESEIYNKLHALRTSELQIENENEAAIKQAVGLDYEIFLGRAGQQNLWRVTRYSGFKFTEPDKVDLKIWKDSGDGMFIPNKKTKLGREMDLFLSNLKSSNYNKPLKILGLETPVKFSFPYVEIAGDIIVMRLDDQFFPEDENLIEITKKEFDSIRRNAHNN